MSRFDELAETPRNLFLDDYWFVNISFDDGYSSILVPPPPSKSMGDRSNRRTVAAEHRPPRLGAILILAEQRAVVPRAGQVAYAVGNRGAVVELPWSVRPQRAHRIDARRPACRDGGARQRHQRHRDGRRGDGQRVADAYAVDYRGHQAAERHR